MMIMCSEADLKKFFSFKTDNLEKLGVWFHHSPNIKKTHKTGRFERLQRVFVLR